MRNKGYDLEGLYRFSLAGVGMPGKVTLRGLGTRTKASWSSGIIGTIPAERAGVNLGDTPKWKAQFSQTWEGETVSVSFAQRYISKGVYSNEFIECQTNCPVSTAPAPDHRQQPDEGRDLLRSVGQLQDQQEHHRLLQDRQRHRRDPAQRPGTNTGYGVNPRCSTCSAASTASALA